MAAGVKQSQAGFHVQHPVSRRRIAMQIQVTLTEVGSADPARALGL